MLPSGLLKHFAEWSAVLIETVGVAVIVGATLYVLAYGLWRLLRGEINEATYGAVRQRLGRGILLGLEFLVAGDIVHTVAVDLTYESVAVLGLIVLIRTFLSFTLEVELEGRWPWHAKPN